MKHHNKGFTLVELIVGSAIMGILALAAMGFMSTGARTYSSVNYTLRLQYESQLALAQLQTYLLDCNDSIEWDDATDTLSVIQTAASGDRTLYVFQYDSVNQCLYFGSGDPASTVTAADLLAEHLTDFSANIAADATTAKSITLELTFQRQTKSYTGTQTIALRNHPTVLVGGT